MTPRGGDRWRLERRFAMSEIHSDLARRVFPLFVTDWHLHQPAESELVVLSDYAQQLHRSVTNVSQAFDRLVARGWLAEGPRVGTQRTFAPGSEWRRVTHPERQSA